MPKGRKAPSKKKNDLGDPLPQHLQEFVHTAKHKLPGWLDPDERKLLRKERRRIKDAQKSSAKELVASKAEKERIDLDVYNHEQKRERGGWNANRIKVAFQLCSEDRVAVETQPRNHTTILHAIQSCEGAQFDRTLTSTDTSKGRKSDEGGRKGLWTVPLAAYDACLARCIGLRSDSMDVVIVPVDPKHLKALRGGDGGNKSMMKFESMQGIPKELATHLYPFQKVGVEFCVAHGGRALIGDEMGLGSQFRDETSRAVA